MNAEEHRKLAAMIELHQEFTAARDARLAALVRAQALIMSGTLTVGQVGQALGCSAATWHRWSRDLGLRELAVDCVAEIDQALRSVGASEHTDVENVKDSVDAELALGAIGVWKR